MRDLTVAYLLVRLVRRAEQTNVFRLTLRIFAGSLAFGWLLLIGGCAALPPAPNNYEPQATTAAGVSYLGRAMSIGANKVFVLTGRLPTTPKTRNGEPEMQSAEARYWSLTSYDNSLDLKKLKAEPSFGAPVTSIMDDEIVTDKNGWYTIVYSRAIDRPRNATAANGVT